MKIIAALISLLVLGSLTNLSAEEEVRIRQSQAMVAGKQMGSRTYVPLEDEGFYVDQITEKPINFQTRSISLKPSTISDATWKSMEKERLEKEKQMVSIQQYQLFLQAGQYVGWLGIVRSMEYDASANQTRLRIEHKYFDGITDIHLQVVSIYGAGDFVLVLPGQVGPEQIPLLSLVRAYGKVSKEGNGLAVVKATYVRVWDWGLFTFADYGRDKSNQAWVKLRQFQGQDVYSGSPTAQYYEARLGQRTAAPLLSPQNNTVQPVIAPPSPTPVP